MKTAIESNHWNDINGNPEGGCTYGNGFAISWQRGPLGRGVDRKKPNGASVEDIISAAIDRLEFYQSSKFNCEANKLALSHLIYTMSVLNERTRDREKRGVEGTHEL